MIGCLLMMWCKFLVSVVEMLLWLVGLGSVELLWFGRFVVSIRWLCVSVLILWI